MTSGYARLSRKQKGFSLIEALVAAAILSIGMLSGLSMILVGALGNNRAKLDTSATLLAQNVEEIITGAGAGSTAILFIKDCTGVDHPVATAGATGGGSGSPLVANNGAIDFSAGAVGNYSMTYIVCRADGDPVSYEVRWNVTNLRTVGALVYTKQVTVAARPIGAGKVASGQLQSFALPVTLRGVTSLQ